jgi:hypothetical protein
MANNLLRQFIPYLVMFFKCVTIVRVGGKAFAQVLLLVIRGKLRDRVSYRFERAGRRSRIETQWHSDGPKNPGTKPRK